MRFWLIIAFLMTSTAQAAPSWDWSEPAIYQENHDPSMIWLRDGRQLRVQYTHISWETVETWKKGKTVLLAYKADTGLVLYDPQSDKTLPVLRGVNKHPIDILTDQCLNHHQTTSGMVDCYGVSYQRWDSELNRAYKALREIPTMNAKQKQAIDTAQWHWMIFRDTQFKAIAAVYDREGTIWRIEVAAKTMDVVREQAQRLNSLLE